MSTYFPASIDFGMAWFYPQYVRNHKNRSHREHCFCVHVRGNRARKQLQTVSFLVRFFLSEKMNNFVLYKSSIVGTSHGQMYE